MRGLQLLRNYGQHNALLAGLRDARLPLVLTIDDDLQHPPARWRRSSTPCRPTSTWSTGVRPRNVRVRCAISLLDSEADDGGHTRARGAPTVRSIPIVPTQLVAAADEVHDPSISIDVLLSWATNRIDDVAVRTTSAGRTVRVLALTLLRHAANMITGYCTRPLRWVSVFGVLTAFLGFALLLYILIGS